MKAFLCILLTCHSLLALSLDEYKNNPAKILESELKCLSLDATLKELLHGVDAKTSKDAECVRAAKAYDMILDEKMQYYKLHFKLAKEKSEVCEAFMFGFESILAKDKEAGKKMLLEKADELIDCSVIEKILKDKSLKPKKKLYAD